MQNNKSLSELLAVYRNSIAYLESRGVKFNIDEVLELGFEQLILRVKRRASTEALQSEVKVRYGSSPLRDGVKLCNTWQELVKYCAELGEDIEGVGRLSNSPDMMRSYYYEDAHIRRITQGEYKITSIGDIVKVAD